MKQEYIESDKQYKEMFEALDQNELEKVIDEAVANA